jgi:hypothetical protein
MYSLPEAGIEKQKIILYFIVLQLFNLHILI